MARDGQRLTDVVGALGVSGRDSESHVVVAIQMASTTDMTMAKIRPGKPTIAAIPREGDQRGDDQRRAPEPVVQNGGTGSAKPSRRTAAAREPAAKIPGEDAIAQREGGGHGGFVAGRGRDRHSLLQGGLDEDDRQQQRVADDPDQSDSR